MVQLQIINKTLQDKSINIIYKNDLSEDYFTEYKDEYNFILTHWNEYKCVPDKETFVAKFNDFDFITVDESEEYLIKTLREEHLYAKSVPILTQLSELLKTDSYEALEYLKSQIPNLTICEDSKGIDIISQSELRLKEYIETKDNTDTHFIPSGFEELDSVIGGFHCGEELVVVFARTGNGKSWVVIKMLEHAWKTNKRVGLLEPEMSANKTGYRFDTLHKNISNTSLIRGKEIQGYEKYINNLSQKEIPFYVAHPRDFNRKVTVSKLKSWVENNKLDILAIDGISYLTDERKERNDNRTTQLTNISEDLMDLSIELGIPVIVVCQSNREGAKESDLSLENIRDSDGIAYNSSLVLSVQQKEQGLQIAINKNRNGSNKVKLTYLWDIDCGKFQYIPSEDSGIDDSKQSENLRRMYSDREDEF